ncbi:MAG: 4Fe-4S binding protein [Chloroflexota bacterium]
MSIPLKVKSNSRNNRNQTQKVERLLAVAAIVTLVIAWFAGYALNGTDYEPVLAEAAPAADRFEPLADDTWTAYQGETLLGYVAVGEADGYGGPLQVATFVTPEGLVMGTAVIAHKETPSFFKRVTSSTFADQFAEKPATDGFVIGNDIHGVTGATYTAVALADATRQSAQTIAREQLALSIPEPEPIPIQFGIPEITVIVLFAAGWVGHRRGFKYTRQLRWVMLLAGMLILGFWYNQPLTIGKVNTFLLGYWPAWQTALYWYLLIGGIFLVATVDNKNAYCAWFCPFGAAQECMGVVGGAKYSGPRQYRRHLMWGQRGLAWLAVMLAFLFRNPGISSYEVFGTLFDFTGSTVMFILLGIVLITSLFVKRPWCNFLCPLDPVFDIVRLIRTWVIELWQKIRQQKKASAAKTAAPSK